MVINKCNTLFNPDYKHFYPDILNFFQHLKSYNDIPNIIFYGPINPLKYILVNTCLEILTNPSIHNILNVQYTITRSTNKQIDKLIKQSDYHIIINPSGNNSDRYIVQNIIKDYARNKVLDIVSLKYKIVLITNAHNLSLIAQASLRRTMEQFNSNCRFIMICDQPLIKPLESRCFHIRVPLPTDSQLSMFLLNLSLSNQVLIPISQLLPIVKQTNKNIDKLIWFITYSKFNFQQSCINDFDIIISQLYSLLIQKNIFLIPTFIDIFFNCTVTGISPFDIIKYLSLSFISKNEFSLSIIHQIIKIAINCSSLLFISRRSHNIFRKFIIDIISIL